MTNHIFSKSQTIKVIIDVLISAKVWNWVVNVIPAILLLVLVLGAAGRGADWIGEHLSVDLDEILVFLNLHCIDCGKSHCSYAGRCLEHYY